MEMAEPKQCLETNQTGDLALNQEGKHSALQCSEAEVTIPTTTSAAYSAPPDGGLVAWLQVLGSFFLLFNSWGIINTYGVFQTYYETAFLHTESPSYISWIGSIQAFLLLIVGVITGPLYDAGWFRELIFAGSALIVFGFMMTSLCAVYYQVILAQAICIGVGAGCIYIPAVAIIPQYFSAKKSLAMGLVSSGSSLGGVLYPLIFRQLLPQVGFAWTTRVLGFIALATCSVSLAVMRVRQMPKEKRNLLDLTAFTEPPYALFCAAMFFAYLSFFGPVYYVQSYAIQTGIMSKGLAFYLLSILNAASVPGRILPGYLAGRVGPINILLPATAISAILVFCWIAIHGSAGIIVFSALYGFFSGGIVTMSSVTLYSLTPDYQKLGTRMGMCSVINAFGSLAGTPICGAILAATGSFVGLQVFLGITMLVTSVLLMLTRLYKAGPTLRVFV